MIDFQKPELFTTNELGTRGWMTKTDRMEIRKMYECDGTNPGPGRFKVLYKY